MKKIISFDKELEFNSIVGDIKSISLDHTLKFDKNSIVGELIVSGSYRITEASRLEDDFNFKIPVEIIINEELEPNSINIEIEDFKYSVENNDTLSCHIEIKLEGVEVINMEDSQEIELIKEDRECDDDMKEEISNEEIKSVEKEENEENTNINSIFTSLTDNEETFSTYSIYVMQPNDSIENILNKYDITKEELENYNNLSSINPGSKIIIPSNYEND